MILTTGEVSFWCRKFLQLFFLTAPLNQLQRCEAGVQGLEGENEGVQQARCQILREHLLQAEQTGAHRGIQCQAAISAFDAASTLSAMFFPYSLLLMVAESCKRGGIEAGDGAHEH